jgi:hypothetical protein
MKLMPLQDIGSYLQVCSPARVVVIGFDFVMFGLYRACDLSDYPFLILPLPALK